MFAKLGWKRFKRFFQRQGLSVKRERQKHWSAFGPKMTLSCELITSRIPKHIYTPSSRSTPSMAMWSTDLSELNLDSTQVSIKPAENSQIPTPLVLHPPNHPNCSQAIVISFYGRATRISTPNRLRRRSTKLSAVVMVINTQLIPCADGDIQIH